MKIELRNPITELENSEESLKNGTNKTDNIRIQKKIEVLHQKSKEYESILTTKTKNI